MVIVNIQEEGEVDDYHLPGLNSWIDFPIDEHCNNENLPKLKLKVGTITPLWPPQQYINEESRLQPLTLVVVMSGSRDKEARGQLYEDEGDGYEYLDGHYLLSNYYARYDDYSNIIYVSLEGSEGKLPRPKRRLVVRLFVEGITEEFIGEGMDGEHVEVNFQHLENQKKSKKKIKN